MLVPIPTIISNIILQQTYKIIFIITISLTKYLKYTFIQQQIKEEPLSSLRRLCISIKKWANASFHRSYENYKFLPSRDVGI